MDKTLNRFLKAQEKDYQTALSEIRSGRKRSHWMWYIFPQITGLGSSPMAVKYAIRDLDEAKAYLDDPILGSRLKEISQALLDLRNTSALDIFGYPDNLKLRSCMTLFSAADASADSVFTSVLDKYFAGELDDHTKVALQKQPPKVG
jgi:uncharacterized protein (DUF1810 family)